MGSYVPNTNEERQEMLKVCGYDSFDDMFSVIPDDLKLKEPLNLPEGKIGNPSHYHRNVGKEQDFPTHFPWSRCL